MKGYRTFAITGLKLLVDSGVLGYLLMVDWQAAGFAEKTALWIAIGLSLMDKVLTVAMRMVTNTPVFAAEPTPQQAAETIKQAALRAERMRLGLPTPGKAK